MTALEKMSYADARRMLLELEAWLRTKNKSEAESLREAFEETLDAPSAQDARVVLQDAHFDQSY
jgi:hypothetical protein